PYPSDFTSFPTRRSSDLPYRDLSFYFIATPALPYQAFVFGRFAAEKCTSLVVTSGTDARSPMWIFGRMAHKYPNILIHCVFSTKDRKSTRLNSSHEWISY